MVESFAKNPRSTLWTAGCCWVFLAFIGCDNRDREQASGLLERIVLVQEAGSLTGRQQAIHSLESYSVSSEKLRRTRDACAAAYQGVLDSEAESARARLQLAAARKKYPNGGVPLAVGKAIEASIERSNAGLAAGKQALPECERLSRALVMDRR